MYIQWKTHSSIYYVAQKILLSNTKQFCVYCVQKNRSRPMKCKCYLRVCCTQERVLLKKVLWYANVHVHESTSV